MTMLDIPINVCTKATELMNVVTLLYISDEALEQQPDQEQRRSISIVSYCHLPVTVSARNNSQQHVTCENNITANVTFLYATRWGQCNMSDASRCFLASWLSVTALSWPAVRIAYWLHCSQYVTSLSSVLAGTCFCTSCQTAVAN